MASATLTAASNSNTFTTVAGTLYSLGVTGHFGAGSLNLEIALTDTDAVFSKLDTISQAGGNDYRAVGSKLRVSLINANSSGSVNVEVNAAV